MMSNRITEEYDFYKAMLNNMRMVKEEGNSPKHLITEEEMKAKDAIAITDDPKFGTNVLQNQIDAFRASVNPGAKFSVKSKESGNEESNALVYFPSDKNLVFTGTIPTMSGLKFQFSLNDVTDSPYVFVDGLALTPSVLETLKRLKGFYENWKTEWLEASSMLEMLGNSRERN